MKPQDREATSRSASRPLRLDEKALGRLRELLTSRPEVVFAAIFGSLASRGVSAHDVDVAVKVLCEDKYACLSKILDEVAEALEVDPELVDLVDLDRADAELKRRVVTEGLVLVDRGYSGEMVEELSRLYPECDEYLKLSIREWLSSEDPTSVDLVLVKRRIDFIKSEVSFLEEYVLSKSPSEVGSSPVLRRLLERSYQLIVEAMLDVCRHVVSAKGWGPCFTAREFVERCRDRGVLDEALASGIVEALKLRNIIVHRYVDVDYDRLYAEARRLTKLARDFEAQLAAFLRRETR